MYFSFGKLSKLTINKLSLGLNKWRPFGCFSPDTYSVSEFSWQFFRLKNIPIIFYSPKLILSFPMKPVSYAFVMDFVLLKPLHFTHR